MDATFKYFSDYNGETIELAWTESMRNKDFEALFPGVKGLRYDSFSKRVGKVGPGAPYLPLTRAIEFKKNPSLHKCDARCMNAQGNKCECSCQGRNHGKG
jgi:hypothetical protein